MMAQPNFATCCRLCLSMDDLRAVFEESADDRSLQQKISSCLGIEILAEDKLSTMVCNNCIDKINNWQLYKVTCSENQSKLEQWLMSTSAMPADLSDGNIQIKEEPIEQHDITIPEVVMNGDVTMKNEPVEEEYNELPPPLTPQGAENDVEIVEHNLPSTQRNEVVDNPRKCTFCEKVFTTPGNRKKHEKMIHRDKLNSATSSDVGSLSQDERSQSSVDSHEIVVPKRKEPSAEEKKILFAAGLKLLQKSSTPPISLETLSKIELSYIEKCKAMVSMYHSLRCACHNASHPNLKGLLSHLRAMRIWFPVFTCYHCMITFTDRSSSTKHYLKCPRSNLETLVKLSNLKRRSEVKTRLYQLYKCTMCRFMFSFHEDFCAHVDEEHGDVILPFYCSCGRIFNSLEEYKDHSYISCLVEFYCDICFVTISTLNAFERHAAELHDNSEGFALLQDDNYKQRRYTPNATRVSNRGVKREINVSATEEENNIYTKRRSSQKPPILESEDSSDGKVINPMFMQKIPGTVCPVCNKKYSSNNNMWRHYKTHFTDEKEDVDVESGEKDDSIYCCPDCGGMFNANEWEKHKVMHKKKTCNECGKVFQFQSELDQHRSVHLNLKLYRDSKTQAYKSTMASPTTESGQSIVMMCEVCDKMFTSKEQLREHKATHEMPVLEVVKQEERKRFSCKVCNKQYAGYGGLWDHNRKKHPEMKTPGSDQFPKKCEYCEKVFNTGGSYFMHKQMHERNLKEKKQVETLQVEEESPEDDSESYHTCKRCFKVFSTKSNLRNHMKSHGGSPATKIAKKPNKKVWCHICHSAFDSAQSLEKHKMDKHNDSMPMLTDEQTEVKAKPPPFVFTCDVCVQTFTTKIALKKHKEKHAREVKPIIAKAKAYVYCKYCKVAFANAAQLTNHMKDEHEEFKPGGKKEKLAKNFGCKLCGKRFTSTSALYAHQGWHKRTNKTEETETMFIKEENEDVPPQFQCNRCSAVLPNDTALQIHILERHRNVNATVLPARCTMCNLDFGSQDEYDQHKRFHAMVEKQPKGKTFACTQCPAAFTKADLLKHHVKQYHKEEQEYKCHYCERVFEKANSLSIHLKVHEKQRQVTGAAPQATVRAVPIAPKASTKPLYSCSICNKGFDLPKDLRNHTIQAHPF